jgi:hypothetical protein
MRTAAISEERQSAYRQFLSFSYSCDKPWKKNFRSYFLSGSTSKEHMQYNFKKKKKSQGKYLLQHFPHSCFRFEKLTKYFSLFMCFLKKTLLNFHH